MENKEITLNDVTLRVWADGKVERKYNVGWRVCKGTINKGYVTLTINYKHYFLHRIIAMAFLGLDITNPKSYIDHIDRNPLNNNVSNLRIVSHQQNTFNTNAKGCSWHKARNKWRSEIKLNGKYIHLGLFNTEEEARNAYLTAKEKYHIHSSIGS